VLGERLGVSLGAQLVQDPCRALDVREEEGDGAGGKLGPHAGTIARRSPADNGADPLRGAVEEERAGLLQHLAREHDLEDSYVTM
jgi:hypothetical protein